MPLRVQRAYYYSTAHVSLARARARVCTISSGMAPIDHGIYRISSNSSRGLLISPFALCAVNSRARYIRGRGRIVHVRSINFTVCVMHGLFEGAVYSEGANYSRKYGSCSTEY